MIQCGLEGGARMLYLRLGDAVSIVVVSGSGVVNVSGVAQV